MKSGFLGSDLYPHSLAVWSWTYYLTSLWFSALSSKMQTVLELISQYLFELVYMSPSGLENKKLSGSTFIIRSGRVLVV